MDKDILAAWDNKCILVKEWIATIKNCDFSYMLLLKNTIRILFDGINDPYGLPDYTKISEIDNGDYQGTFIYVIGGHGYQPSAEDHWYTSVDYGSCSGCDTIERIANYSDDLPDKNQIEQYWTLCLHMLQKMKRMGEE